MKIIFLSITTLLLAGNCLAQGLQLTRGNTIKNLTKDRLLEISFSEEPGSGDCEFCTSKTVIGTIEQVAKDSITMLIIEKSSYDNSKELKSTSALIYHNRSVPYTLPSNGIFYIIDHKNKQRKKRKNIFGPIGGILLFTGIMSSVSAFIVSDKSDRKKVWSFGAGQVGLGVILIALNSKKKYGINHADGI